MPVEIRELVIKVKIADQQNQQAQQREGAASETENEKIIEECVRQVMEILKRSKEK